MKKFLIILVIAVVLIVIGFIFWPPCSDCVPKTTTLSNSPFGLKKENGAVWLRATPWG